MWFLFALGSSVSFGLRGILYYWTSKHPIDRNLMLLGVFLSGAIISLIGCLIMGEVWNASVWVGAVMGLCSFMGNVSLYKGYAVGKTALIAMLSALAPVVVVILAFAAWGEVLNRWQLTSFVIIMAGLLMIRYSSDLSLKNLQGAHWGLLVMVLFGLTDFLTKLAALLEAPVLPTVAAMFITGSICLALLWFSGLKKARVAESQAAVTVIHREIAASEVKAGTNKEKAASASVNKNVRTNSPLFWSKRRTLLWGMMVGITNVAGMIFAMPAFALGVAGLVSVILASNLVLVMLFAGLVAKEKFTLLELGGLAVALIGIAVLKLTA